MNRHPACRRTGRVIVAAMAALATTFVVAPPAQADEIRDKQWHLDFLKIAEAHRITKGAGVTVAVVDSGVDAGHPDLTGSVLSGNDFTGDRVDVLDGRTDLDGHGTAMAGLIAAHGHGNGAGALGVAPQAKILSIRDTVSSKMPGSDTEAGIRWAISQGVKVISLSLGAERDDAEMREAIQAAQRADIVVVAAAGNRPDDKKVIYPAAYPGVIAVGGVDRNGRHAEISVTGPEVVLTAPAVDITTTGTRANGGNGYHLGRGTSDATAIVAGAVALVRAKYPHLKAPEVIHRLTATATDKGAPGRDDQYGYGIVNVVKALTADVPPLPEASLTPPNPDTTFQVPGPAPNAIDDQNGQWPAGAIAAIGVGCLLLVGAVIAVAVLLLRRRPRT
ncbi:type VII secretion-associated serine protease mycosin [Micromonospora sp. NPDC003197]